MIDVNELRKGVTFTMDGELFKVLEFQHHKPGRGKDQNPGCQRPYRSTRRLRIEDKGGATGKGSLQREDHNQVELRMRGNAI